MFDWFAGPGAAFKEPLPKSTNYLNAYDTAGSLVRAPYFKPSDAPDANDAFSDQQQAEQAEKTEKSSEQTQDKQEEEGQAPRRQKSERLLAEQKAARERDQPTGLPAETPDDLMPFPMNRAFRSQAVLSEELREEVYRRIMIERKSVRDVSAALGIEMRRVGAVVRLKALEKQIEDKVRLPLLICFTISFLHDENTLIGLEDFHHGFQNKLQLSENTFGLHEIYQTYSQHHVDFSPGRTNGSTVCQCCVGDASTNSLHTSRSSVT